MRLQMPAQVAEILVRPSGPDLAIESRLGVMTVPAKSEAVAIGARSRFERPDALRNQRMRRIGHVVFERRGFPAICNPAAHKNAFAVPSNGHACNVASRIQRVTSLRAISAPSC